MSVGSLNNPNRIPRAFGNQVFKLLGQREIDGQAYLVASRIDGVEPNKEKVLVKYATAEECVVNQRAYYTPRYRGEHSDRLARYVANYTKSREQDLLDVQSRLCIGVGGSFLLN